MSTPAPPPGTHPPFGYAFAGPAGQTVLADPESAGLIRKERPGWAIGFAVLGLLLVIGSFATDWFRVRLVELSGGDVVREEPAGISSVVDVVREVSAGSRFPADPDGLAGPFFPGLAIALPILCGVLALLAAVGLRHKLLTNSMRLLAVALCAATACACLAALWGLQLGFSLGLTSDATSTVSGVGGASPDAGPLEAQLHVHAGVVLWWVGGCLLAIAAMLGPRVTYDLPPSGPQGPGMATAGFPGHRAAGPGHLPQHLLTRTTQVVAIVLTGLGALLGFLGYGFLPWGADTSFSEVGEAVREYGVDGKPVTEAYFAWLGWVILLGLVITVVVVALGKGPTGVNPKVMRPILATCVVLAGLVHGWVTIDGGTIDIAQLVVGLALLLSALGALLPLRTSVRMVATHVGPQPGGPSWPGQP